VSDRTCQIDDCDRPHVARGWCKNHWRRWKKYGDPLLGMSLIERHAAAPAGHKVCSRCETTKPLCDFRPDKRFHLEVTSLCKPCLTEYSNEYSKRPKARRTRAAYLARPEVQRVMRKRFVRYRYGENGLAVETRRLAGSPCDACGMAFPPERMAIDHCHDTQRVRGLLFKLCNTAIGHANNDPQLLRKLADYLESKTE